jgi:hypothetical protein
MHLHSIRRHHYLDHAFIKIRVMPCRAQGNNLAEHGCIFATVGLRPARKAEKRNLDFY